MKCTSFRRAIVPTVAAIALSASLAACGGGNETAEGSTSGNSGDSSVYEGLSGELAGGGSSAQESAQNAWIVGFGDVAPDVTVSYDPQGSGAGRENFISGGYTFAGSDAYLTDDEGELSKAKETCGADPIEIPNYVSPIAVIFNVEGVDSLKLSPTTLADIFAGKITKWNDPKIAADNKGVKLPSATINAVHRSDESGTTENFTDYLDAAAPKNWTEGAIETWPSALGGEGAKGTDGVVAAVSGGENSIGYADASKAADLDQAEIKVGMDYIAPSPDAAAKILEVSPRVEGRADTDMAFDLDHTTSEAGVYPIVLTSYLLACQSYDDEATTNMVKGYLTYILSDDGQSIGSEEAGSAPLPDKIRSEAQAIVEKIGQ